MLKVSDLSKRFGSIRALDKVSFTVPTNAIAGVIGPNGAGKTTLLLGMAGLMPMDGGTLCWEDKFIPALARSDILFYVEDAIRPHAQLQAGFVLRFYASSFSRPKNYVDEVMDRLQLRDFARTRVSELSKGTMKRLLLALGLLSTQQILMLDEPFDGLDLKQMVEVVPLLRGVSATGRTLVLSIHQLRDAERACDQFILLSGGKIAGQGTLSELRVRARCGPGSGLEEVFLNLV
jgi:ABC-2 type transport system ATP-binding protein